MKTIIFTKSPIIIEGHPAEETLPDGKKLTLNFEWFVKWLLDNDTRFNSDGIAIRSAIAIEKAIADAEVDPEDELRLLIDDAHWERLRDAAEKPSAGQYPIRRGRACVEWIDAIANAK